MGAGKVHLDQGRTQTEAAPDRGSTQIPQRPDMAIRREQLILPQLILWPHGGLVHSELTRVTVWNASKTQDRKTLHQGGKRRNPENSMSASLTLLTQPIAIAQGPGPLTQEVGHASPFLLDSPRFLPCTGQPGPQGHAGNRKRHHQLGLGHLMDFPESSRGTTKGQGQAALHGTGKQDAPYPLRGGMLWRHSLEAGESACCIRPWA